MTEAAPTSRNQGKLRNDIQALRGVAVLLVLVYHAGVSLFPAGYLGVDIFFVISGYLITGLIARDLAAGTFTFRDFYFRRAKRLLPASLVVVLATIVLAPFFITGLAFEDLKEQVLGALTFTTNFVLWGQTDYFDTSAETKPLLHFWSLAIEEQYYIVMPLLLVLAPARLWLTLIGLTLSASLAACLYFATLDPTAAFYAPWNRAWELALGSLAALIPWGRHFARTRSLARIPAVIALLAIPAFPLSQTHPGLDAIVVTFATLLILIGRTGGSAENAMTVRGVALLGNISYSLYLVHWPILVFTRASWLEEPPGWAMYMMAALSIPVGIALYALIERPFHNGFKYRRWPLVGGLVVATIVTGGAPAAISSIPDTQPDFDHIRRNNYGLDRACAFGDKYPFEGTLPEACRTKNDARVLVWGDSYAMAWTSALIGPLAEYGLEQATRGGCDPLYGMSRFPIKAGPVYNREYAINCITTHKQILEYASQRDQIEVVAIAGRFATILSPSNLMLMEEEDGYSEMPTSIELAAQGLAELAIRLHQAGKRVAFVSPPPADGRNIGDCLESQASGKIRFGEAASCDLLRSNVARARTDTWKMLELAGQIADVPVIDIDEFLCDATKCRTSIDGTFIYRDSGHLAYEGAALIGEQSDIAERILTEAR